MVVEFKVARGWKAIADMVGADSEKTAREMAKRRGLPVKLDDKKPTLASWDYVEWHENLPQKPGQKSGR